MPKCHTQSILLPVVFNSSQKQPRAAQQQGLPMNLECKQRVALHCFLANPLLHTYRVLLSPKSHHHLATLTGCNSSSQRFIFYTWSRLNYSYPLLKASNDCDEL